ncbi:YbjQ family protein [Sinorhizobium meliloti]|uniref:YbjQ family protein n=1 Tax=Rhizobium meliloti TaxID=382 RepID=UPI000FD7B30B|nr:YbjQ family protein [Sinorhizobium meliloti]RVP96964.1 YbjQ family protein [Sinorhizobium meliloti]
MKQCVSCRQEKYFLNDDGICDTCAERLAEKAERERIKAIILTTGFDIPNRKTEKVIGIVASEAALGMNIFRDIANNWRDILGGRSTSAQNTLQEARTACLDGLRREAARSGADAVIAVDLDYNELSTAGSGGIVFVAATGTAVKLAPSEAAP